MFHSTLSFVGDNGLTPSTLGGLWGTIAVFKQNWLCIESAWETFSTRMKGINRYFPWLRQEVPDYSQREWKKKRGFIWRRLNDQWTGLKCFFQRRVSVLPFVLCCLVLDKVKTVSGEVCLTTRWKTSHAYNNGDVVPEQRTHEKHLLINSIHACLSLRPQTTCPPKTWHVGIFEIFQKLLGIFEILEKLSVDFEIFQKFVGKFEIIWKCSGNFEIILNSSGQFWNYGKIMGSFDIYLLKV